MQLIRYQSSNVKVVLGKVDSGNLIGHFSEPDVKLHDLLRLRAHDLQALLELEQPSLELIVFLSFLWRRYEVHSSAIFDAIPNFVKAVARINSSI